MIEGIIAGVFVILAFIAGLAVGLFLNSRK